MKMLRNSANIWLRQVSKVVCVKGALKVETEEAVKITCMFDKDQDQVLEVIER